MKSSDVFKKEKKQEEENGEEGKVSRVSFTPLMMAEIAACHRIKFP